MRSTRCCLGCFFFFFLVASVRQGTGFAIFPVRPRQETAWRSGGSSVRTNRFLDSSTPSPLAQALAGNRTIDSNDGGFSVSVKERTNSADKTASLFGSKINGTEQLMVATTAKDDAHNTNDEVLVPQSQSATTTSNHAEDDSTSPLSSPHSSSYTVPTVKSIMQFAIPAIGVWLCSPLLSMIDTSVVGVMAGTAQQAALNPATAVTDYSARCMSFLYTGATSLMARQQGTRTSQNSGGNDHSSAAAEASAVSNTFLGALQLSLRVGSALAVVLLIFAPAMLRGLIGNEGIDPTVLEAAIRYVRIRALGMPAAAMIGTAQASCLGLKDVVSPLKVISTAAVMNLFFDLVFVRQPGGWLGGAAGAAWATILSQYIALGLFLRSLRFQSSSKKKSSTLTEPRATRGLLSSLKMMSLQTWMRLQKGIWPQFRPFVVPVTTTQVGRCSTYIAMGHVISSCLGTNSVLAANQIVTAILYSLIPISDSLGLTAQTFLPALLTQPENASNKATALRQSTLNFLKAALLFGATLATLVASIPLFMGIFTNDVVVQGLVQQVLPVLVVAFGLHGIFCGSEGILLAHQDLTFLGSMYGLFFAIVPAAFLRMKHLHMAGKANIGLATVWRGFLCYHLVRMALWVGRVIQLQRRCHSKGLRAMAKGTV